MLSFYAAARENARGSPTTTTSHQARRITRSNWIGLHVGMDVGPGFQPQGVAFNIAADGRDIVPCHVVGGRHRGTGIPQHRLAATRLSRQLPIISPLLVMAPASQRCPFTRGGSGVSVPGLRRTSAFEIPLLSRKLPTICPLLLTAAAVARSPGPVPSFSRLAAWAGVRTGKVRTRKTSAVRRAPPRD
jgi:hypothetical protein